jgi:hypothetical protein
MVTDPNAPAGPTSPSASPATPTSPYLAQPRRSTSREELEIDWDHPVHAPRTIGTGSTVSVEAKQALPVESALAAVAGNDARPLLVLRDCTTCTGTDDALLTRQADNEKTMLLSRWFHCVRLSPDVLEEDHPFHALFAGEDPSHLFLAGHDGAGRTDLDGEQSRTELWAAMEGVLDASYRDRFGPALKELTRLLDRMDAVDQRIDELVRSVDREVESRGAGAKLERLETELARLREERAELRARATEISTLRLRSEEAPAGDPGG